MKLFTALVLTSFIVISIGCKKEDTKELQDQLFPAKMSAKVGGVDWTSLTQVTTIQSNKIHIIGTSTSGTIIELTTMGIEAKKYDLNISLFDTSRSASCEALYKTSISASISDFYIAKKGSIEISSVDATEKRVSGIFNFTLYKLNAADSVVMDSISIKDGIFMNLKYTE